MTIRHTNYYFEDGLYIDLMPYMEPDDIKPLIEESIIESSKGLFRAERYHWTAVKLKEGVNKGLYFTKEDIEEKIKLHCYVFIDITLGKGKHLIPSPKKPSYVAQALKEKKIKITKVPYHIL
jgi:hypothetical protein